MPLNNLFNPKSIAVVGASKDPKKIGHITLRNLIESRYKGNLYPVNPSHNKVLNLKCYVDVNLIPEVVDLVIICVPINVCLQVIESAAKYGVKNFIVYTAGFKEIGLDGLKLETELNLIVNKYKLNLLGPNCFGYANTKSNINATFGSGLTHKGNLKFISQSGAIAASIFDYANSVGLGFDEFITLGNKSTLSENDVLDYFEPSENTPIGMYLESLTNGKDFINKIKKFTKLSPVFVLKPGKSRAAKLAMQSHTGSMAGEDNVLQSALKESGVIRCESLEDLFDLSMTFSWLSKAPKGPNIAVVSNAGGPAVITADYVSAEGLTMIPLNNSSKTYLSKHLPRSASLLNPIDLLGDALSDRYKEAVETVCKNSSIDMVLVLLTPQTLTEIEKTAKVISDIAKKYKKPLVCSFIGGSQVEKGSEYLHKHKIPTFKYPKRAVYALARLKEWHDYKTSTKNTIKINKHVFDTRITKLIDSIKKEDRQILSGFEVSEILNLSGINTAKTAVVSSISEAKKYVADYGYPVVLKVYGESAEFMHKKELNGVVTNIDSPHRLDESMTGLLKISPNKKVIIQKHIEGGIETIVGIKKDSTFGYTINFGAGGTLTELISDINLRIIDNIPLDTESLIKSAKIYKLLNGYRGEKPYDITKIKVVIDILVDLINTFPEFSELEINPLIISKDLHGQTKLFAVDGKGILE